MNVVFHEKPCEKTKICKLLLNNPDFKHSYIHSIKFKVNEHFLTTGFSTNLKGKDDQSQACFCAYALEIQRTWFPLIAKQLNININDIILLGY